MKTQKKKLLALLPDFIEEHYPKGKEGRGTATVAITLFVIWAEINKNI